MFLPLHDDAPLRHIRRPIATWGLIGLNVLIWALGALGLFGDLARLDTSLGVIPAVVTGRASLSPDLRIAPVWATFLISPFLHANFIHLIGNMAFLHVFGDNVEDALGSARFVLFWLLCAAAGVGAYVASAPDAEAPLIGASGAVSGVIASYLLFHPNVRVFGLVFNVVPVRVSALWIIGAWISLQVGAALLARGGDVGWWAHVGGVAAGLALTPLMRRPGAPFGWSRGAPSEEP
jgi:membrane associated rhomboid family serine protease